MLRPWVVTQTAYASGREVTRQATRSAAASKSEASKKGAPEVFALLNRPTASPNACVKMSGAAILATPIRLPFAPWS